MADTVKFTEEELTQLREIQSDFNKIIIQFGQIHIDEISLSKAKAKLDENKEKVNLEFNSITEREKILAEKLNEKYGPGVLDPTTGIFTANISQ